MKKIFKCKNLFLVTFLAIAGFFSATAIIKDKQVEETPVMEEAEANNVASKRYYVKLNYSTCQAWENDGAWFAVCFFTSGSGSAPSTWVKAYSFGDHTFGFDTPSGTTYPNWAFARMNPASTEMSWNNVWGNSGYGQTTDLGWEDDKDFFLVGDSGTKPGGSWDNIYYSSDQIQEHIVDNASATAYGKNFVMRVYSVTYHSNFAYSSMTIKQLHDSHPDIFWDTMNFINDGDGAIDVSGSEEDYYDENNKKHYRSYKFSLPWWIEGCKYKIHIDSTGAWCNSEVTVSTQKYERRWFNQGGEWYISGYISDTRKYNEPLYSITYETNGGSVKNGTFYRKSEKTSKPSPNPTKSGYLLQKWTETNSSGAAEYTFGNPITSNILLYAQWKQAAAAYVFWQTTNSFKNIYYWGNGRSVAWPGTAVSKTVTIRDTASNTDKTVYYYEIPSGNTPANVIFNNKNGDSGNQTGDLVLGTTNGNVDINSTSYYYQSPGSGTTDTNWKTFTIYITYKDQGNASYSGDTNLNSYHTHYFEQTTTLPIPTKSHYTFGGWYTNQNCTGNPVTTIEMYEQNTNITLYAKWIADSFTIEFDINSDEASGTTDSVIAYYGSSCTLTANGFSWGGHNFDGWAVSEAGSVVYYNSATIPVVTINSLLSGGTVDPGGTYVLYAHWTSGEGSAITFAQGFNSSIGGACTYAGGTPKSDLAGPWATQATAYGGLADYVTYWLDLEHSSNTDIVECIGKYNYVYGKYGTEYELADFMGTGGKSASAIGNFNPYNLIVEGEDNTSIIIIVVASSVSILSITALSVLMVKKRKSKEQ